MNVSRVCIDVYLQTKNDFKGEIPMKNERAASVVSVVLSLVLTAGICAAGYFLFGGLPELSFAGSVACVAVMIVWTVVNIITFSFRKRKLGGMKGREAYEYGVRLQKQLESDFLRAEQRAKKSVTRSFLQVGIVSAVAVLVVLFAGGTRDLIWMPIAGLFGAWIVSCPVRMFLTPVRYAPEERESLLQEDYPCFFALARRAAKEMGCERTILLAATDGGIGVREEGKFVVISLNPIECKLLTQDELYSVLLHEFAHVVNRDTARAGIFRTGEVCWNSLNGIARGVARLFYSAAVWQAAMDVSVYETFSSRHHEMMADEAVKKASCRQDFINATAKAEFYFRFDGVPRRELIYDVYASEQPVKDFMSRKLALFLQREREEADEWRKWIAVELPARIDSHPTLRQRMEAMDTETYDTDTRESDEVYCAECDKLLALGDRLIFESVKPRYAELRRTEYLERREQMERYEAAEHEGEELLQKELTDCMYAYYGIDNEKALRIAERILEEDEGNAYAHFIRARIYFERMDARCVEDFRAAMKRNPTFFEGSMDGIGRFALLSGNEALLAEYRSTAPEGQDAAEQEIRAGEYKRGMPLRSCTLSEDTREEIRVFIEKTFSGLHYQVYLAGFAKNATAVIVRFRRGTPSERINECMNGLFTCLDLGDQDYWLSLDEGSIGRALRRAKLSPFIDHMNEG